MLPTSGLQHPSGREPIVQKEKLEEPACGMGGTQTLAAGWPSLGSRPAPAPWSHHPTPLTGPAGGSWRTLVSNCCFRTSPPELSLTRRLGSVTSGAPGRPNWGEIRQRRAPKGPRVPRPGETRPELQADAHRGAGDLGLG